MKLPVVEAESVLATLDVTKQRGGLDGCQRQVLDEVISDVEFSISAAEGGVVSLQVNVMQRVLRCLSESQRWISVI